jgi:putative PIG3 family NAD(P)H quinone oxidoreductase
MRAILCEGHGDESVMRWAETDAPTVAPGTVSIDVISTSVNRADLLQRMGFYPPPPGASPILGLELAGRVHEVGEGVTGWRPGDEVMALVAGGGYASRAVVDARHLLPVPSAVGLPDAGAVPEVFLTAYLNLFVLGGLERGSRVLIHGGSGGVGTAAIQLARHAGAEVWTTAGGPERTARCEALGAHKALDHRATDFAAVAKDAGGVDVVLDVMGAAYLERNLKALRPDGRLVVIGLQGGVKAELDLGRLLRSRLTVIGSTLRARSAESKAELVARFREHIWPLLDRAELAPVIDRRLPLAEAARAHQLMARGEQFGKLLLTV